MTRRTVVAIGRAVVGHHRAPHRPITTSAHHSLQSRVPDPGAPVPRLEPTLEPFEPALREVDRRAAGQVFRAVARRGRGSTFCCRRRAFAVCAHNARCSMASPCCRGCAAAYHPRIEGALATAGQGRGRLRASPARSANALKMAAPGGVPGPDALRPGTFIRAGRAGTAQGDGSGLNEHGEHERRALFHAGHRACKDVRAPERLADRGDGCGARETRSPQPAPERRVHADRGRRDGGGTTVRERDDVRRPRSGHCTACR